MKGNPFVYYLDQYNVLSPNHSKIYDEYTIDPGKENSYVFKIETKIEDTLINIFQNNPQSVILTGNAGDGKTRLCRIVHDYFSKSNLEGWPEEGIIEFTFLHGKLRIVKDLSELKDDVIKRELLTLQNYITSNHMDKIYYLIAANEGKLTKFLSQNPDLLELADKVSSRFKSQENNTDSFSVFNLLDVTSSVYVERLLEKWNQPENWSPCTDCAKSNRCIIYLNHKRTVKKEIQQRLVEQYKLLDYLDTHITIREMLIHISYMLTGGYTCDDINNGDYKKLEEQTKKAYYQNFYGHELDENAFSEMKALKIFKSLDPGNYSHSTIDDFIINGDINGDPETEEIHKELFDDSLDLQLGYFLKKLRLYRDYNAENDLSIIEEWIPRLRRKFFFEVRNELLFNANQLLPFEYINQYQNLFNNTKNQSLIKRSLINGLNRIFSGRLTEFNKNLLATNKNLIVYESFKTNKDIELEQENERKDIDRIPSKFELTVEENVVLPINLAVFEYLLRANGGGTHNILQHEAEILIDTFKNEIIRISEPDDFELNILRYDSKVGLFVEDEISLD
ncbi:hypothetical protein M3226_30755 [Neobacillus cucumis]|uniref:hypothetical protein n=1 Tax=Neobacillus cucumis TaxID=1740721 RepID=UPI00203BD67D|nr:hypothetical protein [Neobacillus cucumis]MCM3729906.1 hypothetical protein [Neobacillus cucumis]